MHDQKACLKDY